MPFSEKWNPKQITGGAINTHCRSFTRSPYFWNWPRTASTFFRCPSSLEPPTSRSSMITQVPPRLASTCSIKRCQMKFQTATACTEIDPCGCQSHTVFVTPRLKPVADTHLEDQSSWISSVKIHALVSPPTLGWGTVPSELLGWLCLYNHRIYLLTRQF